MKVLHLLTLSVPILLAAAAPAAPPARQDPGEERPVLSRDQLHLVTYSPVRRKAGSLLAVLQHQGWYRILRIQDSPGTAPAGGDLLEVGNMTELEGDLLLYDLPERVDRMLEVLAELDHGPQPDEQEALDLGLPEVFVYRPRAVSLRSLQAALQSFVRGYSYHDEKGQPVQVPVNISWSFEDGILMIRDYPEQIEQLRSLIEKVDQPAPQGFLSCLILRGNEDEQGAAPDELQQALRQLLPYRSYSVEATGAVRLSLRTGSQIGLTMSGLRPEGRPESFVLSARSGSWDRERQALTLERCEVSMTGYGAGDQGPGSQQIFRTDTTIYGGEFAVLGVAGSDPLFVVLRLQPVEASSR